MNSQSADFHQAAILNFVRSHFMSNIGLPNLLKISNHSHSSRIRFYVFLKIQKTHFYVFLKWHFKKNEKKRNPKISSFRIHSTLYNQTVNDGVAHSKNPRKCAYHVTFDLDLELEHTLDSR